MRARVLCVGHDNLLSQTRSLVLAQHFDVEVASTLRALAARARNESFDLVVLCHSLSWQERFLATEMVQKLWPTAKVLEVLSACDRDSAGASSVAVQALDGPTSLVATARGLLDPPSPGDAQPESRPRIAEPARSRGVKIASRSATS